MTRWQASRYVHQPKFDTMSNDWRSEREAEESLIVRNGNGPVGSPQCNIVAKFMRTEDRDEAVRIVNAHDALVAALERVIFDIDEVHDVRPSTVKVVEDALAAARG
ncbi:hypothetical protein [Mesorhizobium sp. M1B.F.Ca.ET.045.04.1.1]|uniref:hypothetical protein n=1 Tax=Mesorhizobium sp. M1B.F.Ca.ET.045.04.1.1 TaxID=2493673 RepID=UPI000F754939|nr:hypothetical protein [Mesorhizobium sp. M1B.F.Ca.ET.045.04.1.1]AZO29401.1 hypothetical protein EJ071_19740 [Mesorhizobium sp. M1B.F.Ca.ET.045.04.1.1]